MQKKPVRIGLIGVGKMGRNHLRVLSLLAGAQVVWVYDIDRDRARNVVDPYDLPLLTDLTAGLDDVDAVVICSPTSTHRDVIKAVADKVSYIFVEKPLADTVEECEEIVELCKARNLRLQVGFIERYNPAISGLKNVLETTERIYAIDFTRTNKLSDRIVDVDVISDLMVHDLDLAVYLCGPVSDVVARGIVNHGMVAYASAFLHHSSGVISRVIASRITEKKTRLIQATCDNLFVDCNLLRKEILINRQSVTEQEEGRPYRISSIEEAIEVPPHESLLLEHQDFLRFVRGETDAPPGAEAGLAAARLCARIREQIVS